jgi:hypothetical protein
VSRCNAARTCRSKVWMVSRGWAESEAASGKRQASAKHEA